MHPIVEGIGLHNLWIFWYFIYLWACSIINVIAFLAGLIKGFSGNNFVEIYEQTQMDWYDKFITNYLY
eukprot:403350713